MSLAAGIVIYLFIAFGVGVRIDVLHRNGTWFAVTWAMFWPLLLLINFGAWIVDLGEVQK